MPNIKQPNHISSLITSQALPGPDSETQSRLKLNHTATSPINHITYKPNRITYKPNHITYKPNYIIKHLITELATLYV